MAAVRGERPDDGAMASAELHMNHDRAPAAAPSISVLCVTLWGDRAEAATFVGLARRGCHVRVCCMPTSPYVERFEAAGIEVVPLPIDKRIDWRAVRRIRAELASRHWDILHLLHNRGVLNGLLAVRGMPGIKVVAYRGIVGNVSFLSPSSWLRYLNPRVDRVVCVAEAIRRHFLEMRFLGLKLRPEKFVTIHKGHDLAWYDAPPLDLQQFGIPAGAFVVGCIANWRPRKGVHVLLEAFAQVAQELPIYLLLAGTDRSRELDEAIAAHPHRDRIRNVGFRRDAPALIGACDVSVLPALKREGLPKTVIEAMAYGVPPVVTNVGGSPELVADGVSGLVVPPGDAAALAARARAALRRSRAAEPPWRGRAPSHRGRVQHSAAPSTRRSPCTGSSWGSYPLRRPTAARGERVLLALIQARLTSQRLPGKVLSPVLGVPMLGRQIERVARARIDRVVVATSDDPSDDPIEAFAAGLGVACFRGSLGDVLDRMYRAARANHAEHVVRLTGDCPLIHHEVIDTVVSQHLEGGFDFTSNTLHRTYPHGVDCEVMRFAALERAWREATAKPAREHVTTHILSRAEMFRLGSVVRGSDWSGYRWTVDYPEDLELVRTLFERLYGANPDFSIDDIVALYAREPALAAINAMHNRRADDAVAGALKLLAAVR